MTTGDFLNVVEFDGDGINMFLNGIVLQALVLSVAGSMYVTCEGARSESNVIMDGSFDFEIVLEE